ncbi:MAG: uroporphyrinogen-III synthase, partial [Thermomicrobiales bacterium]
MLPTVRIDPTDEPASLDAAVAALSAGGFDWVMLTSANAVPVLAERVRRGSVPARLAAVGARTADALSNAGIAVDLVPEQGSAEGLLASLA